MFYVILLFREVVLDLVEEYKAAERADYVTWGTNTSSSAANVNNVDNRMANNTHLNDSRMNNNTNNNNNSNVET